MRGEGASDGSVGDIGSWAYTKTECGVPKQEKQSERKTKLCVVTEVRDGIFDRWIK